jgi:hypothetical protein
MSAMRTELMMTALSTAAQVAMAQHGHRHEQAMQALRSGALVQITEALVTRRVDAVQQGFLAVLAEYASDARHHREQQAEFSKAQILATDPLVRVELAKRIRDIDTELGLIRADATLLYGRMTEVILLLGGASFDLGSELAGTLSLPTQRMGAMQ